MISLPHFFAELFSPASLLILVAAAFLIIRNRRRVKDLPTVADKPTEKEQPAHAEAPAKKWGARRIAFWMLLLATMALIAYWAGTRGFDIDRSVITPAIPIFIGWVVYTAGAAGRIGVRAILSTTLAGALPFGLILVSYYLMRVVILGVTSGPLIYLLHLTLFAAIDFMIHRAVFRKNQYAAGLFAPMAAALLAGIIIIEPGRIWIVSPFEAFRFLKLLGPTFFVAMPAAYIMVLINRKVARNRSLETVYRLIYFALFGAAVGCITSFIIYRFDGAECEKVEYDDEYRQFPGVYLASDSLFDGRYYYILEKERAMLKRFDLQLNPAGELMLGTPPHEMEPSADFKKLYISFVDVPGAPLIVVDLDQFRVDRRIDLPGCRFTNEMFAIENQSRILVACNDGTVNLFIVNAAEAKLEAASDLPGLSNGRFYAAFDPGRNQLWALPYGSHWLYQYDMPATGESVFPPPAEFDFPFSLMEDLIYVEDLDALFLSQFLGFQTENFGEAIRIGVDDGAIKWRFPVRGPRTFLYRPQSGLLYLISHSYSSVIALDPTTGAEIDRIKVGRQPRRIRAGAEGELIFCAKCGAFTHPAFGPDPAGNNR